MPETINVMLDKTYDNGINAVSVNVDYYAHRKQVQMTTYPAIVENPDDFGSLMITSGTYTKLGDLPRANKKAVAEWKRIVFDQVHAKNGPWFDTVKGLVEKRGYKLA